MAVDQWLLETATTPVLRIYDWDGDWGTCGYFVSSEEMEAALPGINWVRRWTGGGIVDHRSDWTYTLAIPRGELLAESRGAESYRLIHAALAEALASSGVALAGAAGPARGGSCFENPVEFDLLDASGRKMAGAGQRRHRLGLLHQGSVALALGESQVGAFAGVLAEEVEVRDFEADQARIGAILAERYVGDAWNRKR